MSVIYVLPNKERRVHFMKNDIRYILESKQRPKLAQEIGSIFGTAPYYKNECDYIFDKVEYCEQNRLDRMQAFSKSAKDKNKDLAYQRDYRLVIAYEMPIDHFVRIGKLDNTKILETRDIKEFKFFIGYISHQIDEEMI